MDISNEELVKLYLGEEYNELKKDKFRWSAFLFPACSFAYRKDISSAIAVLIILTASMRINLVVAFLIKILIGINFNKIYLWLIRRKIKTVRNEAKDDNEAIYNIKSQSGRSKGLCFLSILLALLIPTLLCMGDIITIIREIISAETNLVALRPSIITILIMFICYLLLL